MALTEVGARLRLAGAPAFKRAADQGAEGLENLARKANRADRQVSGLERAAGRAGGAISKIGRGAALGGIGAAAAGIGALSLGLLQGFRDAASLQTMMAKTNAVVASTSGVANVSAASVLKMSDQLEALSMIDQEAILQGQNLLLTFTNIRNGAGQANHIFDQTVEAMVNVSAAMGKDPQAAAVMLGKALNDPVKGLTALGKAGVQFSKGQKDQIKALVASGKTMDAQKLILKELEVQFGGAAKAAGSGFEGAMFRAKDALGDLFRDVATPLLPGFTKRVEDLSGYLTNTATPAIIGFIEGFQDSTGAGGAFREDLLGVWEAAKDVGEALQVGYEKTKQIVDFVQEHEDAFTVITAGVAGYALATKAAAGGIALMGGASATASPKVATLGKAAYAAAGPIGAMVAGLMALQELGVDLEIGGKGTYDKLMKGLKGKDPGAVWDAVWGDGFTKDAPAGQKTTTGLRPLPGAAPFKPEAPARSGDDRRVQVPNVTRRANVRTTAAPAATPVAPAAGGTTVVKVMLDRRVLGEAVIDDQEDRVARR